MLERQDDLNCTITSTEIRDDGVTLHCMTNMSDYGKVRFSLTLVSSSDRSGGECFGSGRERCSTVPFSQVPSLGDGSVREPRL